MLNNNKIKSNCKKINSECARVLKEIKSYKYIPDKKNNNNKIKYVDEWGLDKRALKIVKHNLSNWVDEFLNRADFARFQVEICNFKENKLFFFTTCHDKLKDNPEETGIETSIEIRRRKRNICYALLLKQLMGDPIRQWDGKCSHCGNTNMIIKSVGAGSYYRYCKDCNRFVIDTYKNDFGLAVQMLYNKYIEEKK